LPENAVPRFLAIDWDQNQLHIVSATTRGKVLTVQRAAVWQEEQSPQAGNAEELGKLLRERLREGDFAAAPVLACVSRDRLIVKEVRIPAVPPEEEPALVRFQAIKELTDAPEEVVIDYLPGQPIEGGQRRVLALVVRRDLVEAYRQICQAAGLTLVGLAPRTLGIGASLDHVLGTSVVTPAPQPADAPVAVIVTSDRWTELQIQRPGNFLLARSLGTGPGLAGDIRRNLAIYSGQNPNNPVTTVYLAGRGSGELRERLGDLIDLPIHTFDPFAGSEAIAVPLANRGSFAGAVGLLYAHAKLQLLLNFVKPRQVRPKSTTNYRMVVMVSVVGLLLMLGGGVLALGSLVSASAQVAERRSALEDVKGRLAATDENLKALTALEEWESVVWLDEFYDLNARIPDVNQLRILSVVADPLPRNTKSRFVATVTIKGRLLGPNNSRKSLDELIDRMKKEGYYSPEAPKVEKDQFTLKVNVERRPPGEYTTVMPKVEKRASETGTRRKGGKASQDEEATEEGSASEKGGERASPKGGAGGGRGKRKSSN